MYRINRLDPRETQAIDSVITLFPPISTSTVYTQCLMICTCIQHMEYSLQSSVITPFVEATVNALVRRITIGHILPSWTTVSKPKNGIEHGFIIPLPGLPVLAEGNRYSIQLHSSSLTSYRLAMYLSSFAMIISHFCETLSFQIRPSMGYKRSICPATVENKYQWWYNQFIKLFCYKWWWGFYYNFQSRRTKSRRT